MGKKKPPVTDVETELKVLSSDVAGSAAAGGLVSMAWAAVFTTLIRYGALVAIVWIVYLMVAELAGKTTLTNIVVNLLADLKVNTALAYLFGVGGIMYGMRERSVRKRTVQRLQVRNQKLERRIDPGRTTSSLTPRGDTNPADRV